LDGDWKDSEIAPIAGLSLSYRPVAFLSLIAEGDFSYLVPKNEMRLLKSAEQSLGNFKTLTIPVGLTLKFDFAPLASIAPFASVGGGLLLWDARYNNKTILVDGEKQQKTTMFAKAGGGITFRLNKSAELSVGADFRYTMSDYLDQIASGDEKDALAYGWGRITYFFRSKNKDDQDADEIPDEIDLDPQHPEIFNGYLDHDGKPDGLYSVKKSGAPIVLHNPVFYAYEHKDIHLSAIIITKTPLRVAAILYRQKGDKAWHVNKLEHEADIYKGMIPANAVKGDGLEYCIVAVNKNGKGIGYSGLPKRAIQVKIIKHANTWRTLGGVAAALGWGSAVYIGLRKQKN